MSVLTLRLPDQVDHQLNQMAQSFGQAKSALVREAIERFLKEKAREVEMQEMMKAAQFMAHNPECRAEALAASNEFAYADAEALNQDALQVAEPEAQTWWK